MADEMKSPEIENLHKISIPNFQEYQVDIMGNIYRNGKILKQQTNTHGYKHIHLSINGNVTTCLIHRLVAMAFIPNPDGKPCVDHIDGDRTNNKVDNLRWVTINENNNNPITKKRVGASKTGDKCTFYGKRGKNCPHSKTLFQFDNEKIINVFDCIDEACKRFGFNNSLITRCCQHKIEKAYNYRWEYGLDYLVYVTKQMRHNQRRCQRNPTPEKLATLESWERKVDAVVAVLTDTQMKLF